MRLAFSFAVILMASAFSSAAPVPGSGAKTETPAAAARRALDDIGDYNFQARSLADVLGELKDRTRVNITLDPGIMNFGVDPTLPSVSVDLKRSRLRDVLKTVLAPHNLRVGIVRDGLFISHDDGLTAQQLRQPVSVDCDGTPFAKAIAALATDTGANVVIDPRLKGKADAAVVLKLEDVPLETAVRLLAEVADLRAVRMNNVLFVTSPDRAAGLRPDADGPLPASQATPGLLQTQIQNGGVPLPPIAVQVAPALPDKAQEKK